MDAFSFINLHCLVLLLLQLLMLLLLLLLLPLLSFFCATLPVCLLQLPFHLYPFFLILFVCVTQQQMKTKTTWELNLEIYVLRSAPPTNATNFSLHFFSFLCNTKRQEDVGALTGINSQALVD